MLCWLMDMVHRTTVATHSHSWTVWTDNIVANEKKSISFYLCLAHSAKTRLLARSVFNFSFLFVCVFWATVCVSKLDGVMFFVRFARLREKMTKFKFQMMLMCVLAFVHVRIGITPNTVGHCFALVAHLDWIASKIFKREFDGFIAGSNVASFPYNDVPESIPTVEFERERKNFLIWCEHIDLTIQTSLHCHTLCIYIPSINNFQDKCHPIVHRSCENPFAMEIVAHW